MARKILKNSIQCEKCCEILTSYSRNGYSQCSCSTVACDGGLDYLRRIGKFYKELSVLDSGLHQDRRNNLHWGKNYDKDKKLLPKTKWILIKNLTDDHLDALIAYQSVSEYYRNIFIDEDYYRELEICKQLGLTYE